MLDNHRIATGGDTRATTGRVRELADLSRRPRMFREYSRETATAYVIDAVEAKGTATRQDFDINAIVTVSHAVAECWDFSSIEQEIFWRIASHFMVDDLKHEAE